MPASEIDIPIITEHCNDLLTQLDLMHDTVGNLLRTAEGYPPAATLTALMAEIAKAKQEVVEIKSCL